MPPTAVGEESDIDTEDSDAEALERALEHDVLLTHLAKNGGSKAVDPYILKAHAENSKHVNEGGDTDEEMPVSLFLFFKH